VNLPTKLTVLRVVLTFFIMGLLFMPGPLPKALCVGLFVLAALTDWWDGWLARKTGQISALGVLLDPIADKVLVIGLLLAGPGLLRAKPLDNTDFYHGWRKKVLKSYVVGALTELREGR